MRTYLTIDRSRCHGNVLLTAGPTSHRPWSAFRTGGTIHRHTGGNCLGAISVIPSIIYCCGLMDTSQHTDWTQGTGSTSVQEGRDVWAMLLYI